MSNQNTEPGNVGLLPSGAIKVVGFMGWVCQSGAFNIDRRPLVAHGLMGQTPIHHGWVAKNYDKSINQ